MKKIGFIGCGNMGEALLSGALKSGYIKADDIIIHTKSMDSLENLHQKYNITMAKNNKDVAQSARIIILAVKPNIYKEVIEEVRELISLDSVIVAIAPGFSIDMLQEAFHKEVKVARAMPNTPAMVGCGIAGISFSPNTSDSEKKEVIDFFHCSGEAIEIKEELMKAVTAVSGSSPAFIYMLIEAMADGAVMMGIPRKDAYQFAAKAVEGSAQMVLKTGKHPGELKDAVCSPGGTTIEGVVELERNGFKGKIIEAMMKTAEKSQRMQDEANNK